MEVPIVPAHSCLEDEVEFAERGVAGNLDPAPYRRRNVAQGDLQLVDRLRGPRYRARFRCCHGHQLYRAKLSSP
jgi:hypothetical protein